MISLASAAIVYSGSSYSFPSEEFEYWEVVGNSSDMEGMTVTWEDGNITVTFDPLFAADTFTLIFFNNYTEIINEYYFDDDCDDDHHCSGGTRIIYEDRNITVPGEKIIINDTIVILDKPLLEEDSTIPLWMWLSGIALLIIIVLIYFSMKAISDKKGEEALNEE